MNKKITESDLHRIVKEAVNKVLKENDYTIGVNNIEHTPFGDFDLELVKWLRKQTNREIVLARR